MKKILILLTFVSMMVVVGSCGNIQDDLVYYYDVYNKYDSNNNENSEITINDWIGEWQVTCEKVLEYYIDGNNYINTQILPYSLSYKIRVEEPATTGRHNIVVYGLDPNNEDRFVWATFDNDTKSLNVYTKSVGNNGYFCAYLSSGNLLYTTTAEVLIYSFNLEDNRAYSTLGTYDGYSIESAGIYIEQDEVLYPAVNMTAAVSINDYPIRYPAGNLVLTKL